MCQSIFYGSMMKIAFYLVFCLPHAEGYANAFETIS